MPIPIHPQPDTEPPFERCCFCRTPTRQWTELADRAPGAQVACCKSCAAQHEPAEVPTKLAWFRKEQALSPRRMV